MNAITFRKFSVGALLGVGLAAGVASAQTAAEGNFNGSSYKVVKAAGISWTEAKTAAAGMSTVNQACYLATLTSQAENEFVEQLRLASNLGDPSQVYVGGQQILSVGGSEPAGDWFWLEKGSESNLERITSANGSAATPSTWVNWASGEPNNSGEESYLAIGRFDTGQWNDELVDRDEFIAGYVVECDGVVPGSDVVVFNDPAQPVVSVVQEVVAPGKITQYSCVIQEPANRGSLQLLDLIRSATNTSGCAELVDNLPAGAKAFLRTYQRAFANSQNDGKKDIVLTLIRSTDLDGEPADLTRGLVISEENPELFSVDAQECRQEGYFDGFVDASVAPTTVRVNMSGEEGSLATNSTFFCNAPKSGSRYSDQLYAYPIRNRVPAVAEGLLQLEAEAIGFRNAVRSVREVCTNTPIVPFLDGLRADFDAAIKDVRAQVAASAPVGVSKLEDVTRKALAYDYKSNCQAGYDKNAEGQFVSRLLAITYQAYRYVLYRKAGDLAYVVPPDITAELPPLP